MVLHPESRSSQWTDKHHSRYSQDQGETKGEKISGTVVSWWTAVRVDRNEAQKFSPYRCVHPYPHLGVGLEIDMGILCAQAPRV